MIIKDYLDFNPNLSLVLGFFDGVHLAHQIVISNAVFYAKEMGIKSAVITFKDHPILSLTNKTPQYLTSLDERINRIKELGVDYLYILDFDKNFKDITAKDYLENYLVKHFKPKAITTGFNHYFGANKSGNSEFLEAKQIDFGYKYFEIPPITHNNVIISSTKIRELLLNADFDIAKSLLCKNFGIRSVVIEGNKIGSQLGFKTANIIYPTDILKIPRGVYFATVHHKDKKYKALINFGKRPTVTNDENMILEAHILGFNEDIYGETITITPKKFLRAEKKFETKEALIKQIHRDIELIK